MRYGVIERDGSPHLVVDVDGRLHHAAGGAGRTLSDVLALPESEWPGALAPGAPVEGRTSPQAPLRPASIVCIGLNYLDHVRETGMERPERPLVFTKLRTTIAGPHDDVVVDRAVTTEVDWEVELGVVIGRRARHVPVERALDVVFGYTAANDVSARDVQFADGQWVRGKSLDGFCPIGPVVVTPDELGDPQRVALRTRVDGELVQDSSTALMLFGVAELIAFCSRSFTLLPGDLLLTGTPWGCGAFLDPPRYLQDGELLETEVEGIGVLRNRIVEV